ncbi:hypothetical protein [Roseateles sp. BYS87W]|uniref:Uncharacterized protein n=1 Tax=Pelomonas baiyunensis TaxID=3299026 RepID=A0ABW7GYE7_9BURK
MTDLSHWDYAAKFSGRQAAALILGYEPDEAWKADSAHLRQVSVVLARLEHDYQQTVTAFKVARGRLAPGSRLAPPTSAKGCLVSVDLAAQSATAKPANDGLFIAFVSAQLHKFSDQAFSRAQLRDWLRCNVMESVYDFEEPAQRVAIKAVEAPPAETDIDPSDLPEELQAANIAFRAVLNGYGDEAVTFKARLVRYLQANFRLSDEAVQRIATVANPDKAAGRRKRSG